MACTVELCGGPQDGALVTVPDDALDLMIVTNVTNLNSIRPNDKSVVKVLVGWYVRPIEPSLPHPRWQWTGYQTQE